MCLAYRSAAAGGSTGTRVRAGARRPTRGPLDDVDPDVEQDHSEHHLKVGQ